MDEAVETLSHMAERFIGDFRDVEELISEVQRQDGNAGQVLRFVYINRLTVEQITKRDKTRYSKKTIYEYWKRGLDLAFDLLSEEW